MHAVLVQITINDPAAAEQALHEQLVPRVSQAPGFVTGYWTSKDDTGLSMFIFDSEVSGSWRSEPREHRGA
jgi:hypothetical protein